MPVIDIDQSLEQLGAMAVPPSLALIDDTVLDGVARRRSDAAANPKLMGFAALLALVVGVAGGGAFGGSPAAAEQLSPLTQANALAPSTLLDIRR
jgi:hypothetical protein